MVEEEHVESITGHRARRRLVAGGTGLSGLGLSTAVVDTSSAEELTLADVDLTADILLPARSYAHSEVTEQLEAAGLVRVDGKQHAIGLSSIVFCSSRDNCIRSNAKEVEKHLLRSRSSAFVVPILNYHYAERKRKGVLVTELSRRHLEVEAKVEVLGTHLLTDEVVELDALYISGAEDIVQVAVVGKRKAVNGSVHEQRLKVGRVD